MQGTLRRSVRRSWLTRFEQRHGRPPLGVFAAPGRVNLIGEHVDYNGGLCLPMALPHATYAAVAAARRRHRHAAQRAVRRPVRRDRSTTFGPGRATGWAAYAAGVLWALREDGWDVPGMDVVVDGRVPLGAGLSSSAALECAVALAVAEAARQRALDDDAAAPGWSRPACAPSRRSRAPRPAAWTRPSRCSASAESALLLDCRDWSTPPGALGPGLGRA